MGKLLHKILFTVCAGAIVTSTASGQTAYGYLFGSKNGDHGFVSFDINSPSKLKFEGSKNYGYEHVSAGEYVDGKIYTYMVEFGDFYDIDHSGWAVYDGNTFKQITSKYTTHNRVVDMTYDYTTNTMYAIVENQHATGTIVPTVLCAVNMNTGELTQIGEKPDIYAIDGNGYNTEDGLITLACDNDGQLYAMSSYRTLYKVDKFTGKVTPAAPQHNLGTAAQFQSMTFATDGKLWWAQQHPSYGHFCEIDMTTGIPGGFVDFRTDYDKLNKLGDDAQVTALFFKDKQVNASAPLAATEFNATVDENDIHTVNLSWTLPEKDYSDNAAELTGIKVYRIGETEPIADLPANATEFSDTKTPDGILLYEILPYNASGNGFPAFTDVFAGYDALNAVENISIKLEDKTVTLTWDKPTSTINGGYADYDAITYNLVRVKGDTKTDVAAGLDKTEFTEDLDEAGSFYYIIEPVCGGIKGVSSNSETVSIIATAKIPYSTGFEDNEDGSQWTFINKWGGNTGWSIMTDSYAIDGKFAKAYTGGKANYGDDWLISPPIEFNAGDYIIEFDANGSSFDNQTLDILLGTDPDNLESFNILIKSFNDELVYDKNGVKGWQHNKIEFNVPNDGIYHVAYYNKNKVTYAYFKLDNLSIYADGAGIESIEKDADHIEVKAIGRQISVVSNKQLSHVELYDIQGRSLNSMNAEGNAVSFNASSVNGGVYVIAVTHADGTAAIAKVIIK